MLFCISKNSSYIIMYFKIQTYMWPVLTKWATSCQRTKGDVAHWTLQKSMKSKGISAGNNGFWTTNAATLIYYTSYESLESEQQNSGYNLKMKFCNLSLILWKQVYNCVQPDVMFSRNLDEKKGFEIDAVHGLKFVVYLTHSWVLNNEIYCIELKYL